MIDCRRCCARIARASARYPGQSGRNANGLLANGGRGRATYSGIRSYAKVHAAHQCFLENHAHSMALFTTYYNFVHTHKTLRVTPAMAAGGF
jgi:hypothetical protein